MTYIKPKFQDYHIPGLTYISPKDAFTMLNSAEAALLDVREIEETSMGKAAIADAILHPLSAITKSTRFEMDKTLIVMCAHGVRSAQVCAWLLRQGYDKVLNLDGGFACWIQAGLPVEP